MRTALVALAAVLAMPAAAQAAYTGTVDTQHSAATLTGSGDLMLSTSGGLVHHGDLGAGFASDTDFDSSQTGDQRVPDTGGWEIDATGGGSDELTVAEGEPPGPISFAYGHTFFPGGVPCVVRDPNDRHGATIFSFHPAQETRFCYKAGFDGVTTRADAASTDFSVLDTEQGVPLTMVGGDGDDSFSEAANVPSGEGTPHNPVSPVSFQGGGGTDLVTLNDGPVDTPTTYKVGDGAIRNPRLPVLSFDKNVEQVALYPQDGPSTITIARRTARRPRCSAGSTASAARTRSTPRAPTASSRSPAAPATTRSSGPCSATTSTAAAATTRSTAWTPTSTRSSATAAWAR